MPARVRRLWESITEPRHLKAAYWVIYAVACLTGVATAIMPPTAVEGELGVTGAIATSALLAVGGLGGLITVLPGWWWAERLSILLIAAGLGIYGLVSFALIPMGGVAVLGVLVLALATFLVRWLSIRKFSFEPRG